MPWWKKAQQNKEQEEMELWHHTTTPEAANLIRSTGFIPSKGGELGGNGVYLSEKPTYPTALRGKEKTTLQVQLPKLKFMEIAEDTPNFAYAILKKLYGKEAEKVYNNSPVFNGGQVNWPFFHDLLKKHGYDGIKRTGIETDILLFDHKHAKII